MFNMNQLDSKQRAQMVAALVEGNSLRGTARMTGVARMTVEKLLRDLGAACATYQDEHLRNLHCRRIQCDEIWSFIGAKQKNVRPEKTDQWGDVWTWVALDADSKLVPCWMIGPRDLGSAYTFMHDLAERLSHRVQLTTDGHKPYLEAVESAFGTEIDYAMLVKIYGAAAVPPECAWTCLAVSSRRRTLAVSSRTDRTSGRSVSLLCSSPRRRLESANQPAMPRRRSRISISVPYAVWAVRLDGRMNLTLVDLGQRFPPTQTASQCHSLGCGTVGNDHIDP